MQARGSADPQIARFANRCDSLSRGRIYYLQSYVGFREAQLRFRGYPSENRPLKLENRRTPTS